MKKSFLLLFVLFMGFVPKIYAVSDLRIWQTQIPILIERQDNVLFYLRMEATGNETFEELSLELEGDLKDVDRVKLYYGGSKQMGENGKNVMYPVTYVTSFTPNRTLEAIPSYSSLKDQVRHPQGSVSLKTQQKLFPGTNFFWVSVKMKRNTKLSSTLRAKIQRVVIDQKQVSFEMLSDKKITHRMAVGVRHAGDDGAAAFRIPGLVTSNKGTLLGVYDVRYNNSVDLQEYIEIGLSRSTDGGQTWKKMQIPMAFGETGGLPKAQNGVGDPSILVDTKTGAIWIVAAWVQGIGNQRSWFHSGQGMDREHTAQLMMVRSVDDGKTWSEPINVTAQVKDPSWYFLLQGPGRGITMENGNLVFPIQFIDKDRIPNAGIMYSEDRGETWHLNHLARTNTTESQVVEIDEGVLMLNMRDNRGGSRAVCTTNDYGKTWTEHPSSRKALREPVCMASLIRVKAQDNVLGKDLLLFSNPDTEKGRHHITIKASLDGGLTWDKQNQIMLDEDEGWGYTCLTMVDRETVGILYESSCAHMTFQTVKLTEFIK